MRLLPIAYTFFIQLKLSNYWLRILLNYSDWINIIVEAATVVYTAADYDVLIFDHEAGSVDEDAGRVGFLGGGSATFSFGDADEAPVADDTVGDVEVVPGIPAAAGASATAAAISHFLFHQS